MALHGTVDEDERAGQLSFGLLPPPTFQGWMLPRLPTGVLPIARGGTRTHGNYGNNSVLVSNGTGSALSSLNCAW
ncbi:MAG: hypothetical protein IPK04_11410 [Bdellovibrionales bacterium]|nr:hypothetical protein [Bdellovibrionales bacterium]